MVAIFLISGAKLQRKSAKMLFFEKKLPKSLAVSQKVRNFAPANQK